MPEQSPHAVPIEHPTQADPGKVAIVSRKLEAPSHPMAAELLAFWQAFRDRGTLPNKADVARRGIHKLMPYLMLFEPANPEGTDWRCRVIGSTITERLDAHEVRGKTLKEVHSPDIAEARSNIYKQVVNTLVPNIARGRILGTGREFLDIEVVHVPVLTRGGERWLLGGLFFFN